MADRESCERRVYRLATLLTGNPNAAVDVIRSVVDAQPDLSRLDNSHMDRLTALRSREIRPSTLVAENLDHEVAAAVSSLTPQQREAWIFASVYRMPIREAAKAMDCSVHAAELHLRSASEAMSVRTRSASQSRATEGLLAYSMSLDVPEFFRRQRRQRQARRRAVLMAAALSLAIVIVLALAWWRDRSLNDAGRVEPPPSHSQSTTDDAILGPLGADDRSGAQDSP
jgi:hypothetical protein